VSRRLYLLRPLSGFHLGTGRVGDLADLDGLPRSDTIAAALISLWRWVDSSAPIAEIAARPPFAVSCALPVPAGRDEPLFPVLPGVLGAGRRDDPAQRKRWKAVRFMAASGFRALAQGQEPDAAQFPDPQSPLWTDDVRLRLEVDRLGDHPAEGRLFEFGTTSFGDGVRLALICDLDSDSVRNTFEAVLRLLGDEGLGGDRKVGNGRFAVIESRPFDVALGEGARLCLSLLHPTKEEIDAGLLDEPAAYTLVERGGWIDGMPLRRASIRMIAEGSLLRDLGRPTLGDSPKVLDPLPERGLPHPIFRPGRAVTIPATPLRGGW
jgi:CRISPR-associated protein Csm4